MNSQHVPATPLPGVVPPGWRSEWSVEHQQFYYVNISTWESTWIIPSTPAQAPIRKPTLPARTIERKPVSSALPQEISTRGQPNAQHQEEHKIYVPVARSAPYSDGLIPTTEQPQNNAEQRNYDISQQPLQQYLQSLPEHAQPQLQQFAVNNAQVPPESQGQLPPQADGYFPPQLNQLGHQHVQHTPLPQQQISVNQNVAAPLSNQPAASPSPLQHIPSASPSDYQNQSQQPSYIQQIPVLTREQVPQPNNAPNFDSGLQQSYGYAHQNPQVMQSPGQEYQPGPNMVQHQPQTYIQQNMTPVQSFPSAAPYNPQQHQNPPQQQQQSYTPQPARPLSYYPPPPQRVNIQNQNQNQRPVSQYTPNTTARKQSSSSSTSSMMSKLSSRLSSFSIPSTASFTKPPAAPRQSFSNNPGNSNDPNQVYNQGHVAQSPGNMQGYPGQGYNTPGGTYVVQSPQIQSPQSFSPHMQNQQMQNPLIQSSQTQIPQTYNPNLQSPQLQSPQTQSPQLQYYQTQNPQVYSPQTRSPQGNHPQMQNPQSQFNAPQQFPSFVPNPQTQYVQTQQNNPQQAPNFVTNPQVQTNAQLRGLQTIPQPNNPNTIAQIKQQRAGGGPAKPKASNTASYKKWGTRAALGIAAVGALALGVDAVDGGLFDGGIGGDTGGFEDSGGAFESSGFENGGGGGGGEFDAGGGEDISGQEAVNANAAQLAMEQQGQENAMMLLDPVGTEYTVVPDPGLI